MTMPCENLILPTVDEGQRIGQVRIRFEMQLTS